MPVATRSQETVRKDLKTLEGAFVELRQLSFDEMLERRDKAMRMSMEQRPGKKKDDTAKIDFESAMQWTRFFEFSRCIVDHNLEDEQGKKLNFENRMTLKILDPKVGVEIEKYIEDMNEEDDEEAEDFMKRLASSSPDTSDEQNSVAEQS
jgi:hypothetical protein